MPNLKTKLKKLSLIAFFLSFGLIALTIPSKKDFRSFKDFKSLVSNNLDLDGDNVLGTKDSNTSNNSKVLGLVNLNPDYDYVIYIPTILKNIAEFRDAATFKSNATFEDTVVLEDSVSIGGNMQVTGVSTAQGGISTPSITLTGSATLNGLEEVDSVSQETLEDTLTVGGDFAKGTLTDFEILDEAITEDQLADDIKYGGDFDFDGTWAVKGTNVTATAAELNLLDGVTATTAELNTLDGITSTVAELNYLDGLTTTAGGVIFGNGTYLTQDTTNFYFDDTNNRLGIGTNSPTEALDIAGRIRLAQVSAPATTTDKLYNVSGNLVWNGVNLTGGGSLPSGTNGQTLYNSGGSWTATDGLYFDGTNVGVGTESPSEKLEVSGNIAISGSEPYLRINNVPSSPKGSSSYWVEKIGYNYGLEFIPDDTLDGSGILFLSTTGRIGIGTVNPAAKLHIAGSANEIQQIIQANATQTANILEVQNSSGTGLMVVDGSGNVGIGTTGPGAKLDLGQAAGDGTLLLKMAGSSYNRSNWSFRQTTSGANPDLAFYAHDTKVLQFFDGGSDTVEFFGEISIGTFNANNELTVRGGAAIGTDASYYSGTAPSNGMIIEGNVGIGTVSPLSKLGIVGNTAIGSTYGAFAAPTDGLIVEGNVGIGTSSPEAKLHVIQTNAADAFRVDDSTGDTSYFSIDQNGDMRSWSSLLISDRVTTIGNRAINAEVSSGTNPTGGRFQGGKNQGTSFSDTIKGVEGYIDIRHIDSSSDFSGNTYSVYGEIYNQDNADGSGTITGALNGVYSTFEDQSTWGSVDEVNLFRALPPKLARASANLTDSRIIYVEDSPATTGTITNQYGIYVGDLSSATNNYGIYTSGSMQSYFGGNVGIGTTTPSSKLEVSQTSAVAIELDVSGSYSTTIGSDITGTYIYNNSGSRNLSLAGSSSGRSDLVIDTSGQVGINTTSPQSLLDVQGDAGSAGILTLASKELTVVDGDELGRINFNAPLESDGTDAILAGAAIWAEADATFSTTVNSTELVFGTNDSGAATERLRITKYGNMGIGTASPSEKLEVVGNIHASGSAPYLKLDYTASNQYWVQKIGYNYGLEFIPNGSTGGTGKLFLSTTGLIGIGTVSPLSKLGIVGNTAIGSTYGAFAAPTNGLIVEGNVGIGTTGPGAKLELIGDGYTGTTELINLKASNGTTKFVIYDNGKAGIGSTEANCANCLTVGDKLSVGGATNLVNSDFVKLSIQGGNESLGYFGGNRQSALRIEADTEGEIQFSGNNIEGGTNVFAAITGLETSNKVGDLVFSTKNSDVATTTTEAMRIDSTGNVGIGTTNPQSKLSIASLGSSTGTALIIDANGDVFKDSSSLRYKDDLGALTQDNTDFSKILQLEPKSFKYKQTGAKSIGYLAEDLDTLGLGDMVIYDSEGLPDAIKYDRLPIYIIEILKQQQAKIDQLDTLNELLAQDSTKQSTQSEQSTSSSDTSPLAPLITADTPESSSSTSSVSNTNTTALLLELQNLYQEVKDLIAALGMTTVTDDEGNDILAFTEKVNFTDDVTLNNINITGDLQAGLIKLNTLENSINILGPSCYSEATGSTNDSLCENQTLYIQNNLAGNIDFFDSNIVFSPNGDIKTQGEVAGASVKTDKLIVNDTDDENSTIGTAKIKAGETKVTIKSTRLTKDSKIFVNADEFVQFRRKIISDNEFEIEIKEPLETDIAFDWWILSVE